MGSFEFQVSYKFYCCEERLVNQPAYYTFEIQNEFKTLIVKDLVIGADRGQHDPLCKAWTDEES
jgi:hypothetical protein